MDPQIRFDLTAKRFDRWIAIAPDASGKKGAAKWLVRCDCGTLGSVGSWNLRHGKSRSCGCLQRDTVARMSTTHGRTYSPEHRSWLSMIQRCTNPRRNAWKNYGGRGIAVCERWRTFENFFADMGPRPDGTTLDRIDNDGPYSPENCRWATKPEQARNTRTNRRLVAFGIEATFAEWARAAGISSGALRDRIERGWSAERALTTEPRSIGGSQ